MEGFPIIPILFLLFALYGKLRKNYRKASSGREAPPQPVREDEYGDMDVFETVEEPFEEIPREKYESRGTLRESEFGTKEYKEKYDFEEKKRVSQFEEVENSSQIIDISAKQRDRKTDGQTHSFKEEFKREERRIPSQKISALELKEELFSDPKLLQKAFIIKEILDKPVSLRCGSGRKSEG